MADDDTSDNGRHESEPAEPQSQLNAGDLVRAAPGLARIAASAWWRTAGWTVENSVRAGSRVLRAALSGESAAKLIEDAGAEIRDQARRLLEVSELEDRLRGVGAERGVPKRRTSDRRDGEPREQTLRELGEELLRQSADVSYREDAHPAYERILGELAPDEGRILRFLYREGAQPSVDVRAGRNFNLTSELVAPGLSMIGQQSGARYLDRVPAYLNNLYRLGLIWFSREPLENPLDYQVLEAQPEVIEAMRGAGRGKTVRRSIHLTPFGEDFCEVCLPVNTAELDALPGDIARGDGAGAEETAERPAGGPWTSNGS